LVKKREGSPDPRKIPRNRLSSLGSKDRGRYQKEWESVMESKYQLGGG